MGNNVLLNEQLLIDRINAQTFDDIALDVFRYQYENNTIYRTFSDMVRKTPANVSRLADIPFLPVSFFKTHEVKTGTWVPDLAFESSRTTGDTPARHFVKSALLYEQALLTGFRQFYGAPGDYTILALLPSYLERSNASLVHMVKVLMEKSGNDMSGFYLNEWDKLAANIRGLQAKGKKVLLIGVTFALLDFAEAYPMDMTEVTIMETGGMKGRKEEWTRHQVHTFLQERWGMGAIHSEYGMTELLSQAYAKERGIFYPSVTMQVLVRDINDPFFIQTTGSGCLNIIDIANLHSCSFIATDDIGNIHENGSFEVLGRSDHSALRGCNLMVL